MPAHKLLKGFIVPYRNRRVVAALFLSIGACVFACSDQSDDCLHPATEALRVCAAGTKLKGIDVSSYQGLVSWTKVKATGQQFAFARVSDGANTRDSRFATNWPAMKSAGIMRGAYQYFRPSQSATTQANLLVDRINAAGGLKPGDLPPVLDLETSSGLAAATVVSRAKTWLQIVQTKLGVKPIIYSGNNMAGVTGKNFSTYLLWAPNYGVTCPTIASGWKTWTFWQNSDTGRVNGVSGAVDTNFFNGALPALTALTVKAKPVDAGAPPPVVVDAGASSDSGDAGATEPEDGGDTSLPPPASDSPRGDAGTGVDAGVSRGEEGTDDDAAGDDVADDGIDPADAKPNDGGEGATMNDPNVAKEEPAPAPTGQCTK
jgi:lysozyme